MALSGSCHQVSTDSAVPPKSVSGRCRVSNRRATGLWDRPSKPSDRFSKSYREKDQLLKVHVLPGSRLLATPASLISGFGVLGQLIYWHTDLLLPKGCLEGLGSSAGISYKGDLDYKAKFVCLCPLKIQTRIIQTYDTPLGCFTGMSYCISLHKPGPKQKLLVPLLVSSEE